MNTAVLVSSPRVAPRTPLPVATLLATIDIEVVAVSVADFTPVLLPEALRQLLPSAPEMEEKRANPTTPPITT